MKYYNICPHYAPTPTLVWHREIHRLIFIGPSGVRALPLGVAAERSVQCPLFFFLPEVFKKWNLKSQRFGTHAPWGGNYLGIFFPKNLS